MEDGEDSEVREVVGNRESDGELGTGVEERGREQVSLPRADGGKDAWLFLCGCFSIEALVWGFPFSYGVFQSYYSTHPPFSLHPNGIPTIGTSATGIMYLSAPLIFYILTAFPSFRRLSSLFGLAIIIAALISSSFSTQVWHLILTQGVLYAIGGSMLYTPTIFYLDEWFIKRKGLAFGIMWAGTGTSGIIVPFLLSSLLSKYGFATTLRVWVIVLLVLSGPLIYFVKPRLPPSPTNRQTRRVSLEFLRTPTFWFLQASNILESLGFFIPGVYLPSYASSLGLKSVERSVVLALFNSTSVLGAIGMGFLCDRLHVTTVIFISTIGATLSVFLFWGLSTSFPLLIIFALAYGISAGGFSSTWPGVIREIQKKSPGAEMGTLFGLLAAGRGVGAVASGPISEALLANQSWRGAAALGYGTGYGGLIVFTGVSALCGGLSFVGRRAKML